VTPVILALDLGAKLGWAHSWGHSGTWDMSIRAKDDESAGMRLLRFEAKLREQVAQGVTVVVFEAVTSGKGPNANLNVVKAHTKLQAIVERLAAELGFDHKSYNNKTIKARCKAKNKDDIVAAARAMWPDHDIEDDNQADALWCLQLAKEELGL